MREREREKESERERERGFKQESTDIQLLSQNNKHIFTLSFIKEVATVKDISFYYATEVN